MRCGGKEGRRLADVYEELLMAISKAGVYCHAIPRKPPPSKLKVKRTGSMSKPAQAQGSEQLNKQTNQQPAPSAIAQAIVDELSDDESVDSSSSGSDSEIAPHASDASASASALGDDEVVKTGTEQCWSILTVNTGMELGWSILALAQDALDSNLLALPFLSSKSKPDAAM